MQNTRKNMWANNKGFRMEDFIKPDPHANTPENELADHERIGKYNARITRQDALGIDPTVNITTPDFDTEDEARAYALNTARNTPGATNISIDRMCRESGSRRLYGETVAWIVLAELAEDTDDAKVASPAMAPQGAGGLRRAATRTRRNTLRTAARTSHALGYRTLSGIIASHVATGRLVRTGDFLNRIGGSDLPDGQQSWYGRHVKKAYRAQHGGDPLKVWAQHRTTGKWIHVHVYFPLDEALYAGLRSYKGTRHLLRASYSEAA